MTIATKIDYATVAHRAYWGWLGGDRAWRSVASVDIEIATDGAMELDPIAEIDPTSETLADDLLRATRSVGG